VTKRDATPAATLPSFPIPARSKQACSGEEAAAGGARWHAQPASHLHHQFRHAGRVGSARQEPVAALADAVPRPVQQGQHLLPAAADLLRQTLQHGCCVLRLGWSLGWRRGGGRGSGGRGGARRWCCGGRLGNVQAVERAVQGPGVVLVARPAVQKAEIGVGTLPLRHHLYEAKPCIRIVNWHHLQKVRLLQHAGSRTRTDDGSPLRWA
jgi:hypothetical protein